MQGTIEFNLDNPEDEVAYIRCVKAKNLAIALWDMDQYLRYQTKYASDLMPEEVYKSLQKTRDKLHEIMSEHSIDLDELIS